MSTGTRFYNWREGDRSEYLAVYLLSALGLVTQVPRQEDIGFDLVCNLAEQESGIQSFRHHYLGQMLTGIAPSLMSAALLFKHAGRLDLLKSLRDAMRLLPDGSVPPEVQKMLPEVFGN